MEARHNLRDKAAEWVDPSSLTPWELNPRDNDEAVDVVADSITRFGFGAPIVARKADGMVIAGHTRLRAAHQLGLDVVPVRFLDIERAEAEAYALADNKVGEISTWDDTLADVLQGLDADLDGLGWSDEELGELLSSTPAVDDEEREGKDVIPEPAGEGEQPASKVGEVYELGPHRLACGDSTDPATIRALLGSDLVDFLHADPPYGMGKESEGVANDNLYGGKLDSFQMQWWSACRPVLRDNAGAMIWGNAEDLWRLWYSGGLAASERLSLRNELVWDKGEASAGGVSFMGADGLRSFPGATERALFIMLGAQEANTNADAYWDGWEPIRAYLDGERKRMGWGRKDTQRITGTGMHSHWFSRSQWSFPTRKHYEALQQAAEAEAFGKDYDAFSREYKALKEEYDQIRSEWMASRAFFDNTHDLMTDVWKFGRVKGADRHGHATPKPVEMMVRAIRSCCPEGGIVLEPFGGSGSTLIGADTCGRRAMLVELLPRWCDVIRRRWTTWARSKGIDPGTGALD